jgi:hypothetical protein
MTGQTGKRKQKRAVKFAKWKVVWEWVKRKLSSGIRKEEQEEEGTRNKRTRRRTRTREEYLVTEHFDSVWN